MWLKTMFKGIGHIALAVVAAQAVRDASKDGGRSPWERLPGERITELLKANNEFEERARKAERKLKAVTDILMQDERVQAEHLAVLVETGIRGKSAGLLQPQLESALLQLRNARAALKA